MCFSAVASFAGSAIISAIGVATVLKVHKPNQIVFASIPLFFGFQQFVEGSLWFILQHPAYSHYQTPATYIFLVMAQVFWPLMIPLAVLYMEPEKLRKKVLWILLSMGMVLSAYYLFSLFSFKVTPEIMGYHIEYVETSPVALRPVAFVVYLITSITPLFISSIKRIPVLGILMSFSCLVTILFFTQYLTSVWCFFAALISGVIYWILSNAKKGHTSRFRHFQGQKEPYKNKYYG
jgi:hypothetical protein